MFQLTNSPKQNNPKKFKPNEIKNDDGIMYVLRASNQVKNQPLNKVK